MTFYIWYWIGLSSCSCFSDQIISEKMSYNIIKCSKGKNSSDCKSNHDFDWRNVGQGESES